MTATSNVVPLREYRPKAVPKHRMCLSQGELLWRKYGKFIKVEFPSPQTENDWRLTPQGYVGQIKLDDLEFRLYPKIGLDNLFGMLEYAYDLNLKIGESEVSLASMSDIFERLSVILAKRINARIQKGLYRAYVKREERLSFVRGRIDLQKQVRRGWDPAVHCRFEQHTPDVIENQILFQALVTILRTGICSDRTLPTIRKAYRGLKGVVSEMSFAARDCVRQDYNRFNVDYKPSHNICRFILEHTGPTHKAGDRNMLPFLVDMNRLYEKFVAQWLATNSPKEWIFDPHETLTFGEANQIQFDIDMVLRDNSGRPVAVLDTKYKSPDSPSTNDIFQVIAYAEAMNCTEAFLVYPKELPKPLDIKVGMIRVRSIKFGIKGDLEMNGQEFFQSLSECLQASGSIEAT